MKNFKGFTLAEVLITLSILGVVAAITIPNIVQNYQKRLTVTKLQKAYANLETAANNIMINSGCVGRDVSCTGLFDITDSTEFKKKFIELSGLKIIKEKNTNYRVAYLYCSRQSCNNTEGDVNYNYYLAADNIGYAPLCETKVFHTTNANLSEKSLIVKVLTENKASKFGDLMLGKNVFYFVIYGNFTVEPLLVGFGGSYWPMSSKGKYNWTSSGNTNHCSRTDTGAHSGYNCAAKIIQDGWKITY